MFQLLTEINQQCITSLKTLHLFFYHLMEPFIIYLIMASLHPKRNIIMVYNCSQDIKLYLGHG